MALLQFCDLPDELIVRILEDLNIRDLLSCTACCRNLRRIQDTVTLQYRIELVSSALDDNGSGFSLSIAEKLREVKIRQESWTNLRFRERHTLAIPEIHTAWEFAGGVFGYGLVNPNQGSSSHGLGFIELPSIVRGTSLITWELPDVRTGIEDFTHDPSQNLLAFIARVPTAHPPLLPQERRIHLLTMDTGGHHPMANFEILTCTPNVFTEREPSFLLEIMHDYIALLFRSQPGNVNKKQEFFIWNWKSGKLLINFMYPLSERGTRIDSFAFLSPHYFVLSKIHQSMLVPNPPVLQIYDLKVPESDMPQRPKLVRSFELPLVAFGTLWTSTMIRAYTYPVQASQVLKPFWSSTSPRLLAVSIDIFHSGLDAHGPVHHSSFVLFVLQSTLLAGLEALDGTDSDISIPWAAWGPEKTRMLTTSRNERQWICFVHATRYVRLDSDSEQGDQLDQDTAGRIRLLDFNPMRVKRGQPSNHEIPEDNIPWTFESFPAWRPTVISAPACWACAVVTTLPYTEVRSQEKFDFEAIMVAEECLLGVNHGIITTGADVAKKRLEVLCL